MTLHKMNDLFDTVGACGRRESIAHGAVILRGFALEMEQAVIDALRLVVTASPFRHMTTPGGRTMSASHDELRRGRLGLEPARLSLPTRATR
jgi:alkylated DNA repair dioxygenase AlkB